MSPLHEPSEHEQRFQEALVAAVEAAESGEAARRDAVLARYPEFTTELREFFAERSNVERLAQPLRPPAGLAADAPTTGLGERAAAAPLPGTKVGYFGDYELLEEIGRGGMGVVYRARQVSLKRIVALKMILTGQLADDADVRRFHAEAQAAAKLDHAGIVTVFEVGKHEGHHYFSMAYVEGESLARQLAAGLPPPRRAAELIKKVAEAVSYAHVEGVIHRDLKPANILIDKTDQPRLTDFGLAKRVHGETGASATGDLTATGQVLGTPSYMPPEQASGQRGTVGPVSDVYSLGAVLYCMLTGRPPFQAATALDTLLQVLDQEPVPPRQLNSSVPRDLETICLKCLAKEPTKRYASARELVADLDRFLNGQPIQARPTTRRERVLKWMCRRPAAATLLGVSTAAAVGMVALGIALVINAGRLADAAHQREMVERERGDLLTAQVAVARNHNYSSDIYLAGLALKNNDSNNVQNYLDSGRPKPGEADLRGFEWRYLWRKNNPERLNLPKAGIVSAGPPGDEMQRAWVLSHRSQLTDRRLLVFSPDGKYLATTRDLCDAATGKVLIEYDDVKLPKVFFSHDSKVLFAGWRLFDLTKHSSLSPQERGKLGFTIPRSSEDRLVPLGFIGKQNAFVVMTGWQPARRWDATKKAWDSLPPLKPAIRSYDIAGNEMVHDFEERKGLRVEAVSLSAETGLLAVASSIPDPYAKVLEVDVLDLVQGGRKAFKVERTLNYEDFTTLLLSPDGATLAVLRPHMSSIGLYDSATGKERALLDVRDVARRSWSFSGDSKTLLLVGGDGTSAARLRAWNVATGKEAGDWHGKNNNFGKEMDIVAVLSPDGKTIATASSEKPYWPAASIVKLWDTATGKLRVKFLGHRHQVYDITFSPDGKSLATLDAHYPGSWGPKDPPPPYGNIKVWNVSDDSAPSGLPLDTSMITAMDASPDGKTVAVGFDNGKIQLCEAGSLKLLKTLGENGQNRSSIPRKTPVDVLMFSPDGKQLAAGHLPLPLPFMFPEGRGRKEEGSIDIWDVSKGAVKATFPGYLKATRAFNGRLLGVTSTRGPIANVMNTRWDPHVLTIWDVAAQKPRLEVKDGVMCAFSPDSQFASLGAPVKPPNSQCRIKIWEAATGAERLLPHRFFAMVGSRQELRHSAVFSPDGKYLALASIMDFTPEGTKDEDVRTGYAVRLYDVATGKSLAFMPQHWPAVFSPDGKMLVTISDTQDNARGKLTLWDTASGKELGVFSNPDRLWCDQPVFSADGKSFAALTIGDFTRAPWRDGKVITDGTEISMKQTSPRGAGESGFPGKESYFSVHPVYEIHVWDVPASPLPPGEGSGVRELPRRHRFIVSWRGRVEPLAFSPDGQTIYTLAHFDRNLDLDAVTVSRLQAWDVATGKEQGAVGDQGTKFHGLAFAPDGRLLAATEQRLNIRRPFIEPELQYGDYCVQHKLRLWDMTAPHPQSRVPEGRGGTEIAVPRLVPENVLPMSIDPKSLTLVGIDPRDLTQTAGASTITTDGKVQARVNVQEIQIVERATGNVLHVLKGNDGATRLAFSPDGKTLAVGMPDGTIRLWNVAAGRQMLTIQAHAGAVTGLAFRADGQVLASCNETEIRFWHAASD